MVLLKWPIGGPSSILTKSGNALKTVDATHPDFDFSVFRRFPLRFRENMALEFRAEAYNVFNTTHFGNPVSNLSNVNFGQITSASGSRQLQFGARLDF